MRLDMFAFGLLAVSVFTGLIVQGIKVVLTEKGKELKEPNTTAGIVAAVLAILLGVGYALYTAMPCTVQLVLEIIALAGLSWLCAMVGYDKVIQTLEQLKKKEPEEEAK